jgi:hypothetical protein
MKLDASAFSHSSYPRIDIGRQRITIETTMRREVRGIVRKDIFIQLPKEPATELCQRVHSNSPIHSAIIYDRRGWRTWSAF